MTHDELIALVKAHKEGKVLQYRAKGDGKWFDATGEHDPISNGMNFSVYEWRVKPVPVGPKEIFVNINPGDNIGGAYQSKLEAQLRCSVHRISMVRYIRADDEV